MRKTIASLLAVAALAASVGPASAYIAVNGLFVQQIDSNSFNVPYRGQSGDSAFWCAAGDYIRNFRHMPANTRIFRLSEPPRRSGQGIQFSLSPNGAASSTGLAVFSSGPAGSITAATAFALCPSPFAIIR